MKKTMKKTVLIIILGLSLTIGGISNPVSGDAKTKSASYIPEKLLDTLSDSILNSTEKDLLKDMVSDKKLSDKEIDAYKSDKTVLKYKKQLKEYGGYVLRVDADNDGIKDLFFVIDNGGSMGNNSRILLKGKKNGSFKMTSDKMNVTQELAFIKYKNRNYLVETSFDYRYKFYNGLDVICFKNGTIYEKVNLTLKANGYDITITPTEDKYKALAKEVSELAKEHYDINNMDGKILQGNAETALKEKDYKSYEKNLYSKGGKWFRSDINNDGKKEIYKKEIFETSTINMPTCLQDVLITDEISEADMYPDTLSYYNIKAEGIPEMFWISAVDKENIFNLVSYSDETDYTAKGYFINGKTVTKVYEVNFKGKKKITRQIYTRGINYVDDEQGWE